MKTQTRLFQGNFFLTQTMLIGFALLFVVGFIEHRSFDIPPLVLLIVLATLLLMYVGDRRTWLRLSTDTLEVAWQSLSTTKVPLRDIAEVRRVSNSWLLRRGASNAALYNDNHEVLLVIREANYSLNTLREFLGHLHDLEPSIKVDPQYEKLMLRQLEKGVDFKLMTATHADYND